MSLGKGNTSTTQTTTRNVPDFVRNQTNRVFTRANMLQPPVYQGERTAAPVADQRAFFDMTRNFVGDSLNRPADQIDTSGLQALQGQGVDASGILGMIGQRANTDALQQMLGQRADTTGVADAAAARTDTSGIEALMGQQNTARGLFNELYNQDVTTGLQEAIQFATDDAINNEKNLYAAAGRMGSGSFGRAIAEGAARAAAPILLNSAQADRAARFRAADALAGMFNQDRAFDGSMATTALNAQVGDLNRALSGAESVLRADMQGIGNDIGIGGQLANFDQRGIDLDMAARQNAANIQAQNLERERAIASQLASISQNQAQLNAARQGQDMGLLSLLERSGAAQQGQAQAELLGRQQYVADQRAAQQQQYENMLRAAGLGNSYIGETTISETPNDGGGLFNTIAGLGSTYLGMNAPGLELLPGIGAPLKTALTAYNVISPTFRSGGMAQAEPVLMYGQR